MAEEASAKQETTDDRISNRLEANRMVGSALLSLAHAAWCSLVHAAWCKLHNARCVVHSKCCLLSAVLLHAARLARQLLFAVCMLYFACRPLSTARRMLYFAWYCIRRAPTPGCVALPSCRPRAHKHLHAAGCSRLLSSRLLSSPSLSSPRLPSRTTRVAAWCVRRMQTEEEQRSRVALEADAKKESELERSRRRALAAELAEGERRRIAGLKGEARPQSRSRRAGTASPRLHVCMHAQARLHPFCLPHAVGVPRGDRAP